MTRDEIIISAEQFTEKASGNYINSKTALSENYVGIKIFDPPIFAFGYANDELYETYKSNEIIGEHFISPLEWLSAAKTIISFFLPFTDKIKLANGQSRNWPDELWLHGRFEGQMFLKELSIHIQLFLSDAGYNSLIPSFEKRFKTGSGENKFTSNWSERHVAYACGLGTFGLSKGLITEKGVCGRFGSILTELDLPKDKRPYKNVCEYCTMCGACIAYCPVNAISTEGKDDSLCSAFLGKVLEKHKPRYGCGKCQVNIPCESRAPGMV